jgi:hypothetical protein
VPLTRPGPSCRDERVNPFLVGKRDEQSDGATAVGHLERFAGGNTLEQATGLLAKLTNSDLSHVLHGST